MKRKTGTVLYIMQQNIHDISVSTITQKNPILETTFGKKKLCVYILGGKGVLIFSERAQLGQTWSMVLPRSSEFRLKGCQPAHC